jgi:hypothetical protein
LEKERNIEKSNESLPLASTGIMKERVHEKYAWVILLALGLLWLVVGLYAVFLPEGIFSTNAQILRLSLIDAGIAICYILIAAGHQGKHVES